MLKTRLLLVFAVIAAFAFVLEPSAIAQNGGIKGKVKNARGSGIPNATVTVRQDGKDLRTVTADGKGSFTLPGLRPGKYNVVFDADGYSSGVLYNVEVADGDTRDLGDRLILSVDEGSLVIVTGSVFYKDGTSLPGAKVEVHELRGDGSAKRLSSGYTSQTGEFTFRRPPGAGTLRVTAKYKGASGSKDVEVDSAAVYRLAITLEAERRQN